MGKIVQLPPGVVDRIAAGEVVERPASVVKELVENSLDAGARRIRVAIDGAPDELVVSDDGEGMDADDARLCFARHATSKLRDAEGLSRITTLGFRGEALAAIAAVADVELLTRTHEAAHGIRVRVRGGTELEFGPVGCGFGTTVRVRDLFYNTPARRRFLRSASAERRACLEMAQRLALSRPDVAFEVRVDGQLRLQTPGDGDARTALAALVGPQLASRMLPVRAQRDGLTLSGYIGPPGEHRPTRSMLWCFVNGRWVEDRLLVLAACRAFETALPPGRYPVGVLYVTVDPGWVDVNVHPAKLQVRFRDEQLVFRVVWQAIRAALTEQAAPPPLELRPVSVASEVREAPAPAASYAGMEGRLSAPALAGSVRPEREPAAFWQQPPRLLGQLAATYILAEWRDSLLVVDQHVAHERLIYERLLRERLSARPAAGQALVAPVLVHLTPAASLSLRELGAWLARTGWELEPFGPQQWLVRRLPAAAPPWLGDARRLGELLEELASQALSEALDPGGTTPDGSQLLPWEQRLLKLVACRSAVRAGQLLSRELMEQLLEGLAQAEQPYSCPHGRPILVQVRLDELHRRFGRPVG